MGWTQPSVSNAASVGQGGLNDHHEEAEGPKMDIRTLGIDLAKNLFRVHGVDAHGRTVVERELRRRQCRSWRSFDRAWWGWRRAVAHTTGPRDCQARTRGQADESALCTPIRQVE